MTEEFPTLKIALDTQTIKGLIDEMRVEFARVVRSIPAVTSEDGSQWADITDILRLADRWAGLQSTRE